MPGRRGNHPSFARRRGLLDVGGAGATLDAVLVSAISAESSVLGGITSDITTVISAGTSVLATSPTSSSSSSTSSHSSSSPTTSTPMSSHLTTSQPPSQPQTTPSPTAIPSTTTDYSVYSVTSGSSVVYLTTAMALPSATAAAPKSFLQNPALEGGIFTLVGIVVLVILFIIVTCTLRKRRRGRLTEAITFDPGMPDFFGDSNVRTNSLEKRRLSGSSSGHVHGFSYATPQQTQMMGPSRQRSYRLHSHPYQMPYREPPPNPPYPPRSPHNSPPSIAQGSDFNCNPTGGANLTRKYSDRKPVPPLLPNPVHDPSRRLTLPQQFCAGSPSQPVSPVVPSLMDSATFSEPVAKPVEQPYAGT
ncbi:hypothetical protein M404DRAFT_993787 [Pisolithus tinctorius Marx 270]|uniref:Uncharacterized protein n=1 Tax=Pisolithus tinctorius Marx 270 TaxID=870435 RepID=A0A0C3PVE5_PISTI|nr:hypothetical protein M404DRAFT_993787 [Pisolithus tinctorius Marx 270]